MRSIPPNEFGLTRAGGASLSGGDVGLREQLREQGVKFEEIPVEHLVSMSTGECAALIIYTSPKTGKTVVTLVVRGQSEIDEWGESYYVFEGMSREEALRDECWWTENFSMLECLATGS
jgi:hypothetical protein